MKNYTFHWEVRTLIAQFCDAFNDVVIKRYNNDRDPQDQIHVNFVYAPKNRVIHDIVNEAAHIKLPIISVSLGSMQRDSTRTFNKLNGPMYSENVSVSGWTKTLQPVPVNITINMSIITRFQTDMDQILTNFIPYNDPYIVISWQDPNLNHEVRSPVLWNENINLQYPIDINHGQYYRCIADTSFTVNGWIYKNADNPVGRIYKIDSDFTAVSSIFSNYDTMQLFESTTTTDNFIISARPTITLCDPYMTVPCKTTTYTIQGNQYDYVTNIFAVNSAFPAAPAGTALSAIPGNYLTYYHPLSGNRKLSAMYPGFSGIEITDWTKHTNGLITFSFTAPSAVYGQYFDVYVFNEAGYGILTQDAWRPTTNPYVSGTSQYNSYVEWQHPSVSGVYVAPYFYNC